MNETNTDLFRGCGVEVSLPDDEAFLKILETLTRIGIASRKDQTLYQSAHILHKQNHYAIIHFKELFFLDGKSTDFSDDDRMRRNAIACLLEEWGLVKIIHPEQVVDKAPMSHIKVLRYSEKNDWNLKQKYTVGKKRT
jgi:hypothetical protein